MLLKALKLNLMHNTYINSLPPYLFGYGGILLYLLNFTLFSAKIIFLFIIRYYNICVEFSVKDDFYETMVCQFGI